MVIHILSYPPGFDPEVIPESKNHKYGLITGNAIRDYLYRVTDMTEKLEGLHEQVPSDLAIIGSCTLTPDGFAILKNTERGKRVEENCLCLAKTGQCRLRDGVPALLKQSII